jgi:hypothetical protein
MKYISRVFKIEIYAVLENKTYKIFKVLKNPPLPFLRVITLARVGVAL